MLISPNTQLDAVNVIIGSIGESPVNSIENPTNVDVINAISILNRLNRSEQSRGWSFNILKSFTLNPDYFSKKIAWSDSFLRIKGTDGTRYVKRGAYLFNFDKQTDIFPSAITVECIQLVPFDEMPEPMRQYITAEAAQDFQMRYLGDDTLAQSLAVETHKAWSALQEYEIEMNNPNMLDNPEVAKIALRWRY